MLLILFIRLCIEKKLTSYDTEIDSFRVVWKSEIPLPQTCLEKGYQKKEITLITHCLEAIVLGYEDGFGREWQWRLWSNVKENDLKTPDCHNITTSYTIATSDMLSRRSLMMRILSKLFVMEFVLSACYCLWWLEMKWRLLMNEIVHNIEFLSSCYRIRCLNQQ